MTNKNELNADQYVIECLTDAIGDITKILTATKVKTLEETVEDMTVTIPSMVNIPAETNLKALQYTIKNMANRTKVEAVQHTIEHLANTTVDVTTILPTTEIEGLQKAMKNILSSMVTITAIFKELDWDNFEPTDEDVRKARDILKNNNIEKDITEGLDGRKSESELTPAHKTAILNLMLLYHTMIFISDTCTLTIIESRTTK